MNEHPTIRKLFDDEKFQILIKEICSLNPAIGPFELADAAVALSELNKQIVLSTCIEQCSSPTLVTVRPRRPHRKKRIRKKWRKRYGVNYVYSVSYMIPIDKSTRISFTTE